MTRFQIIYWRDIPVQVRARNRHARLSRSLSPRFQKTVHRAAYRAKSISGRDYFGEWRTSGWQEEAGEAQEVLRAVIETLETSYDHQRLEALAHNKGFETHDG